MMTTMFNILKRPDQTLIENAKVEVILIAGPGAAPGFVGATDETILSVYTTLTDANGRWEVDLTPNTEITPVNTYYHVVERVMPNNRSTSYFIIVPDEIADQWVGDHRINTPTGIDQNIYQIIGVPDHGSLTGLGNNDHPQYAFANKLSYTHIQGIAGTIWTINHNLGYYPNYWAEDSAGSQIEGAPVQVNVNQMVITFSAATSGVAYLS